MTPRDVLALLEQRARDRRRLQRLSLVGKKRSGKTHPYFREFREEWRERFTDLEDANWTFVSPENVRKPTAEGENDG